MDDFRRNQLLKPARLAAVGLLLTVLTVFYTLRLYGEPQAVQQACPLPPVFEPPASCPPIAGPTEPPIELVESMAAYFERYPPHGPLKDQFGERGQRAVQLKAWISFAARLEGAVKGRVEVAIELVGASVFPFLADPPDSTTNPLRTLRERSVPDTRGVVIPTGTGNLRQACHLIASLLHTHSTSLPIEIAYAGDEDLDEESRDVISEMFPGGRLNFVDVLSVFNDTTLQLEGAGWAIKPFALLASSFSEVILADADTVFVQPPEVLFSQEAYVDKGAYLFHDRLTDKGRHEDQIRWWKEQVAHPSAEVQKSLAWNEDWAEEGDSGVVVVDKSRLGTWMGMMHTAWQNSKDVREEVTHEIMYGDKESWWLGMELTEGEYEFERYYGGVAGWLGDKEGVIDEEHAGNGTVGVCSYVTAHLDDEDRLLWYNGGLLKNKDRDQETNELPPVTKRRP
ncbi:hypothetical protein IMZ48_39085, partial [Candidatus Bathyarchaeota archaeon]|nr:hypothetical protein [Candidatus Bathyarchaeota archaeon]